MSPLTGAIIMRMVRGLVAIGVFLGVVVWLTQHYQIADRLLASFVALGSSLPLWMTLEQFLAMVIVACVALLVVILMGAAGVLVAMQRKVNQAQHHQAAHELAVQRGVERLKHQVQEEYQRLIGLSTTLTQRLDKRALLQNILQAASQITSLPHTDSVVGLWILDFETDRMRFETGIRCDETYFTKSLFELTESPFSRLLASKQVLRAPNWHDGFPFVKLEKAAALGQASSCVLVPLIIEQTVLGALIVFCHPDLLKGYDEQDAFFNAAWGQLTLALSIAIQGELAILDRLTGVVNHAYFMKRLALEVERCNRYELSLGLLMIDIDNFKAVNDTLGHPQGDAVLKTVAKLIKQEIRAIDLLGRYGGEEFIVMLPETGLGEDLEGSSAGAPSAAERIRHAVEEAFRGQPKPMAVTVSVGVAVRRYPHDRQMDPAAFVRLADEQLYKAKTAGKNRCCVYKPEEVKPVT